MSRWQRLNCTQTCNNIFLFLIMATMFMMMLFSTSFNFSQCLHLPGANYLPQSTIRIVRSFIIVPLFLLTLMRFIKTFLSLSARSFCNQKDDSMHVVRS